MTVRKADIPLNSRRTAYVTREQGAAELQVSPSTWDEMVERNLLPKPHLLGPRRNIPRWCWAEVDEAIRKSGRYLDQDDEPYFRERESGT
jgi:predicted DNA-binding transcriptional regulator AlpA